jgi:hypothetical protein
MPLYSIDGPDGNTYSIEGPEGATREQVISAIMHRQEQQAAAQKEHEKKTGFVAATKAGFYGSLGAAERAIGEATGSDKLKQLAKENELKAQTTFEPTTEEDVANAQGVMSTAAKWLRKNIAEPGGGIVGGYGIPIAAAPIAAAIAPEAVGGAALAGLAGEELLAATAARAAANEARKRLVGAAASSTIAAPAEMGYNIQAQEQAHPNEAINLTAAALSAIPQAALVGFGMPGTSYINKLVPQLAPIAEKTLVPKVLSGELTREEAAAQLAGKLPQYLRAMAANTAAGTGMMVGTETIRRAQAGQDMMSLGEVGEAAKTAGLLSPFFAAMHGSDRGVAEGKLTAASEQRAAQLRQEQDAIDIAEQRAADLEGLRQLDVTYAKVYEELGARKEQTASLLKETKLAERIGKSIEDHPDIQALNTLEGTKAFLKDLKANKNYTEEEKQALRPQLQQYMQKFKQKDTSYNKLNEEQQKYVGQIEALEDLREIGVPTTAKLLDVPLEELQAMRQTVDEKAADSSTPKRDINKLDHMATLIADAIANHPTTVNAAKAAQRIADEADFNRVLERKHAEEAALTKAQIAENEQRIKLASLKTPELRKAYLEDQARQEAARTKEIPAEPKLTAEQKMAQLETTLPEGINREDFRAQQLAEEARYKAEQQQLEADKFYLERQKPPRNEVVKPIEEPVNEPTINDVKGQGNLFTPRTGKPTAEAMRGNESGPVGGVAERPRSESGVEVPAGQPAAVVPKTGRAGAGALGDVAGVPVRNAGRDKGNVAAEKVTLKEAIANRMNDIFGIAREMHKNDVVLPEELSDMLHELRANPPKAAEFADWAANVEARVKEAKAYIKSTTKESVKKSIEKDTDVQKKAAEVHTLKKLDADSEQAIKDLQDAVYGPEGIMESKGKRKGERAPKEAKEPTTVDAMEQTIKDWFNPVWLARALKNGSVRISESIANTDLPEKTKAEFDKSKALYFGRDGSIYFFTDNIPKGNELGVILHEIGEHKGLDNLIGKDRVTMMSNRVRDMATGKGGKLDVIIAKKALKRIEGMEGEKANKELIAYFAEIAVNEHKIIPGGKTEEPSKLTKTWITNLWNAINKALEKLHLNIKDFSAQDLVDVVHGAARLEMGREGEMGPRNQKFDSQSKLSEAEEAAMKAKGYTVFKTPPKETFAQSMKNYANADTGKLRGMLDTIGNKMVGPLFSAHRKANAYYGPESFYTKTTNKIRGTMLMQHTLNSMNFIIQAMKEGYVRIDNKGFFDVAIDKVNNIPQLAVKWKAIDNAMKAKGMSDGMVEQAKKTMAYADRYKELKDKNIKTPAEFTDASYKWGKELQREYAAEFKEWRDMYNVIRKNNRETLIKSGLKTAKEADEWLDRAEYLPLYRITESEGMDAVFMNNLTAAVREQKLGFKTEEFDVGDPMENIVKNQMWLGQRMMRNHTALRLAEEFSEVGLGRWVKGGQANGKNVFSVLKDGVVEHFQVDNPNDAAVFISAPVFQSGALNIARAVTGTLRRGVTITPSFAYRQMWADAERTWMQSGGQHSFAKTVASSISHQGKNLLNDSEKAKELARHGIVGQVDIQEGFDRMVQHLMGTHNDTWLGKAESVLERGERIARNSDLSARATVYDSVVAQGMKEGRTDLDVLRKEAALRAQMMINFNHKGTSAFARMMMSSVPFINARIQSDWRLVDALKGNIPGITKEQARKMLAMKVGKFATFTAVYAMARSGDDDYENANDEVRNRNFLINAGGVPLKIPVAPEYLALKAASEHTYRLLTDQEFEDGEKARKAIGAGLRNMLITPTDMMPTIVTPMIENITNYSFFNDRALVSPTLQNLPANEQYVEGQASEAAKYISNLGMDMFGDSFSPIKIDNVLRGTLGTVGQDAMFLTNWIAGSVSGEERPDVKLNQIPELGAAFYDTEGSQRKNDYYDLRNKIMPIHQALLKYRSEGDYERAREYQKEHAAELRLVPQLNAINNQLEVTRKAKHRIMSPTSTMTGAEKREALDKIAERERNLINNRIVKMKDQLEEE